MYTIAVSYQFFHEMMYEAKDEFPTAVAGSPSSAENNAWFRLWMASQTDYGISAARLITIDHTDGAVHLTFLGDSTSIVLMRAVSAAYTKWREEQA